jgi:hypothetical protein
MVTEIPASFCSVPPHNVDISKKKTGKEKYILSPYSYPLKVIET